MKKTIILLTLALLLGSLAMSACSPTPTLAQSASSDQKEARTLTVTGVGKAYLTPDIAYISVGVHTEDKEASKAVSDNNVRSQKVSDALKKFNIDPKDIQTTNYSIYPQQQTDQSGKVVGILYVVDNTVYVTLRDLKQIGALLDAVVGAGANTINGISFDVADRSKALSEARQMAVKDAQNQANELAKAAGVTLGQVISISVYGSNPVPTYVGKGGGAMAMNAEAPISPGQMIIEVDINLDYSIQ
ncbi:MAG: SIMPL domain-containing protein [Anaerolineales bacterium]